MSPDVSKPAAGKPVGKDDTQSSAGRKNSSGRPQEPSLKCPRCDSPNTKFCYYNNYSLTQPRHFCKTCRRYWTKGGALRNVPIGGGCRKNKKLKSSPRLSGDSKDHSSGSSDHHVGGLKFFQGISPAMDFQLGGVSYPRIVPPPTNTGLFGQFPQFGDLSSTCAAISSSPCFNSLDPSAAGTSSPLMGFNFPFSNSAVREGNSNNNFQELAGSLNVPNSVATSIESLSCMNQDLHWKLQQQRLAMLFVGDSNSNNNNNNNQREPSVDLVEKPLQPILFENLDISKPQESRGIGLSEKDGGRSGGAVGGSGNLSTEWYFDNSYATVSSTPATSSSNVNHEMNSSNWSSGGMQAWSDHMSHYTSLP